MIRFITGNKLEFAKQLETAEMDGFLVQHFSTATVPQNGIIYSAILVHKGLFRNASSKT